MKALVCKELGLADKLELAETGRNQSWANTMC